MNLETFFKDHPKAALAFSGGVDSSYLLYASKLYAADIKAYFVKTSFQPSFELEDAERIASFCGRELEVIRLDILNEETIVQNPADRCYHCKNKIFKTIWQRAREDGYSVLLDGSNASDSSEDRPGMRALKELSVLSPLRGSGLTKEDIRKSSREAGLFTWDKPAYACLATRFPVGMKLTAELLCLVEQAESALFTFGFKDFRVRLAEGGGAKIQLPESQFENLLNNRVQILESLPAFPAVTLDLNPRPAALLNKEMNP